jgi:FAD/FMN-containing dehydrogenase
MFWGEGLFVFPLILLTPLLATPSSGESYGLRPTTTEIDEKPTRWIPLRFTPALRARHGTPPHCSHAPLPDRLPLRHRAALAVVRPGSLLDQWKVLKACAAASKIIIMQAANTGITGGSTPDGNDYDREHMLHDQNSPDQRGVVR